MTPLPYDPLDVYGGSDAVFRLLAAGGAAGPGDVLDRLRALTDGGRGSVRSVFPDERSDPGRVLLEVFALLHWNTLQYLEEEGRGLLAAALALAGLQRRPAWPAAAVFAVAGKGLSGATPLLPAEVTATPPASVVQAARTGRAPDFRPAWPSCLHGVEPKANEPFRWAVSTSITDAHPLDVFVHTSDARPDGVLETLWAGTWTCGGVELAVGHQFVEAAERAEGRADLRFLVPGVWSGEADGSGEVRAWARRQFLRLRPKAGGPATGELTFQKASGSADLPGDVRLHPNACPWVDWQPRAEAAAPAYPGAFATPLGDSLGAAGNLPAPTGAAEEWSLEWEAAGPPVKAVRVTAAVGGRDGETDTDFLRRAPLALRTTGAPVTTADWEQLVADLDPGGRVRGAVARPSYFAVRGGTAAGVDVAFHCPGGPAECEKVAADLAPVLLGRLQLLRPLGTAVRLFRPQFRRGRVVVGVGDDRREVISDARRTWLAGKLSPSDPEFWQRATADFRAGVPAADFPARFAERLLGPDPARLFVRFEPGVDPAADRPEVAAWGLEWVETVPPPEGRR